MAYDEKLAERVRAVFQTEPAYTEMKMFGGICFMVGGNMAVGITGADLMVRPGPDNFEDALRLPHARPMDFTGRPMKGFVYVGPEGLANDAGLAEWVERGAAYARSLPAK
ncbi:MAG: TfoX/Sxy family protein [Chloroflexi bacterium]|nr:TfoX/Sxy family protein [Chloroflexota bacterium]MDA1271546.1 TfoX/Sxy family protein [Chloroflexota bacterium]